MKRYFVFVLFAFFSFTLNLSGQVSVTGELKEWHKITLTFDGPTASETGTPNPFLDYRLNVTFTLGDTSFVVPGYFAADGNAAETSASAGNKWRVHFAPHEAGDWQYQVSFRNGANIAVSNEPGTPVAFDGLTGSLSVEETDKQGRDFRGKGRLHYVGKHHLQFGETGEYFLKVGADSPENFLAYDDFDGTPNNGNRRKSWGPHLQDWTPGDPTWQGDKGKGIIGALNYLAGEGQNAFSFLTMNIQGDDKNVFPYISDSPADRTRMDVSKLAQWEIVFEHADHRGLYLHFKTQEFENDQLLDGGALGVERRLYYRELIARFGHHLALNWNIGEENTNTPQQRKEFAQFFYDHDPYRHNVVIHTQPTHIDLVYNGLVGNQSKYTGISLQIGWDQVHQRSLQWVQASQQEGRPWVVANDEQNSASIGVPHDDYTGAPSQDDIRKATLWGNVMAGGAGVEYYFGYVLPNSDLTCQDYRSRDRMWDYNRYAHQFLTDFVPFWEMSNHNALIGNADDNNSKYCLAKPGEVYLVYLPNGGSANLDLQNYTTTFSIAWFDPRNGSSLQNGDVTAVTGPGTVSLGSPPGAADQDWVVLVQAGQIDCPEAGAPCDDNDPATTNDVQDGDCNCVGVPCPSAGTSCDDGDPNTENDVEDGFCNCSGTIIGGVNIWLEAECATVGSKWTIVDDPEASNGQAALVPDQNSLAAPPDAPEDWVTFTINAAQSGDYKIFGRTKTPTSNDDSFWVRANGGPWQKWNGINFGNYGDLYQWDQVGNNTGGDTSDPVTFPLIEGANTVDFAWRESGTYLDKIFVTIDQGVPADAGPAPPNGCSDCPPPGASCDDGDPSTQNDVQDGNCNCAGTPCPPAGTACDDGDPSTENDTADGNCNCVGTPCPAAGTACDDGDPSTQNDVEDGNCNCVGGDCPPAGTACDDGDPGTQNDVEDGNCNCSGTPCPPAGTACDDGDPSTQNDVEDGNCNCSGTPCPPAGTACDDGDPNTQNDVEDGNCNCAGIPNNSGSDLWLEAECADVGSQWTILDDDAASNDQYAFPPDNSSLGMAPDAPQDWVRFTFSVTQAGDYKVFGRTMTTSGDDDSFWVRANDGVWQKWNRINFDNYGNTYHWEQVGNWTSGNYSDPVTFPLNAGTNTVDFAWREPGARLDKIYVTLNGDLPTGVGPEPANGCTPCPPAGTACDDGDPSTQNDVEDGNCNCSGTPCPPAGTACDDGDPGTQNDVEDGNCNCSGTPCPPAGTACDDGDPSTQNDVEDGNCNCSGTPCPPAGTACDDGDPSTQNDVEDGNCNCSGTPCPPAGTACDDGDPSTQNDVEDGNCNCIGADCPPAGTACDDGDSSTQNDVEDGNCNCSGTPCPPAGTACDDGDPSTQNDVEDGNCNCSGTPCPPAGMACDDGDPSTQNDVEDGNCNCIGADCPPAGTACDDGDPSTQNDVEDGNCNCSGAPCPPAGTACDDGDSDTQNDVEDGNCNCAGTPGDVQEVWLEAECAEVGVKWAVAADPSASNGLYLEPPNRASNLFAPMTPADIVKFEVNVTVSGSYKIFGRVYTLSSNGDSFWVRVNNGSWIPWNNITDGNFGPQYVWSQVSLWTGGDVNLPLAFDLAAGNNVVEFAWREPNVRLDKIFVTLDGDQPDGLGMTDAANCNNCPPAGDPCDDGDPNTVNDQEDGSCNCAGVPDDGGGRRIFEAECVGVGDHWLVATDAGASNDHYLQAPDDDGQGLPPVDEDDLVIFNFDVPVAGEYRIYARTMATGDGDDSFWVRANDEPWQRWNTANAANYGVFSWDEVGHWEAGSSSLPVTFFLSAGTNTVQFAWDEPGAKLDKIVITMAQETMTGEGDPAEEVCSFCQPAGTPCDDGDPTTTNDVQDGACNCAGTPCPAAGNACDDGDPTTENDTTDGMCNCVGTPCPEAGLSCDDGDPATENDATDGMCNCAGTPCPQAGTACDDGDPATENDLTDGFCNCAGTPCPAAGLACDDGDPNTVDDVTDGFCNCVGTPIAGEESIWLEAECAIVGEMWSTQEEAGASNGVIALPPDQFSRESAPSAPEDRIRFLFDLEQAGNYRIYAHASAFNEDANSFWVRVDEGDWINWNKMNEEEMDDELHWDQVGEWQTGLGEATPLSFDLAAGSHKVDFAWREPNTRLDKILIASEAVPPANIGPVGDNCEATSGVEVELDAGQLLLYPNPAREQLRIELPTALTGQPCWLTVNDANGQRTWRRQHQPGNPAVVELDISDWPAGVYWLQLTTADGQTVGKAFVVQR